MSLKGYVPGTVSVQGLHSISEASLKKYLREKIKLKSDGKQKLTRNYTFQFSLMSSCRSL